MQQAKHYLSIPVLQILPHRPPFLFVDRIKDFNGRDVLHAEFFLASDLSFFQGHFPANPIMPGVLVTESLAQTSGLLLALAKINAEKPDNLKYLLARTDMKFIQPARPGQTLDLHARLLRAFGSLYRFDVTASVAEQTIASGTLALAEQVG